MTNTNKFPIVYAKNYHETCLVVVADAASGHGCRNGQVCGNVKDHIEALPAGTNCRKLRDPLEFEQGCCSVDITRTV